MLCYPELWLAALESGNRVRRLALVTCFAAVLATLNALSYDYGLKAMRHRREYMNAALSGLMMFPRTPERLLLLLHDDAELVRNRAQRLMDIGIIVPTENRESR